jgi:flagellar assembly protein FliH
VVRVGRGRGRRARGGACGVRKSEDWELADWKLADWKFADPKFADPKLEARKFMALIKPTSPRANAATGGVFDLSDLREGAARALREANAEAASIVAAARREADALRTRAREEGFAEGRAAGLADGRAEGLAAGEADGRAAAHAERAQALDAMVETISAEFMRWHAERESVLRAAERDLASIAVAIAESIVRAEVRHDPTIVAREVAAAIALFAGATRITVSIAPEDEALVAEALPALRASLAQGAEIALEADARVARGGCVVRTGDGSVDARLETRFARMREALVGEAQAVEAQAVEAQVVAAQVVEAQVVEARAGEAQVAAVHAPDARTADAARTDEARVDEARVDEALVNEARANEARANEARVIEARADETPDAEDHP